MRRCCNSALLYQMDGLAEFERRATKYAPWPTRGLPVREAPAFGPFHQNGLGVASHSNMLCTAGESSEEFSYCRAPGDCIHSARYCGPCRATLADGIRPDDGDAGCFVRACVSGASAGFLSRRARCTTGRAAPCVMGSGGMRFQLSLGRKIPQVGNIA